MYVCMYGWIDGWNGWIDRQTYRGSALSPLHPNPFIKPLEFLLGTTHIGALR